MQSISTWEKNICFKINPTKTKKRKQIFPGYLDTVILNNFDQQDQEEEEEDGEDDSPFKLSKWEIMDKEEKMGKFCKLILNVNCLK